MYVLLDTNIYLSDPTFSKPELKVLARYLERTNSKLLMPKVVLEEVRKNLHDKAFNDVRVVKDSLACRMKILDKANISGAVVSEALLLNFKNEMKKMPTMELDSEKVTLEKMITKSIAERPPFKSSGRGFRDALIWENLLEFLNKASSQKVAFISKNSKDFGEKKFKESLLEDIASLGKTSEVLYFPDLGQFLTEHGTPTEFLDEDFVVDRLEEAVLAIADSADSADVEINYPGTSDYTITNTEYESYELDNFYISDETAETYEVYAEFAILFWVDVAGQIVPVDYDPSQGIFAHDLEPTNGWINQAFLLTIDKETKDTVEIMLY